MPSTVVAGPPSRGAKEQRTSCWPNELERLLLQAGLLNQAGAIQAWTHFCVSVEDIEQLDHGCYRLFPLVAANLQPFGESLPHFNRINGTLRHAWAKNQRLFAAIIPPLRLLQDSRIEFLLLKGAAVGDAYRQRSSTRSMDDVDILIRPHDLKQAVDVLGKAGFGPEREMSTEHLADLLRFRHELTLRGPDGSALDVHWYLIAEPYDLIADDFFWRDAIPCQLANFSARSLNASDQFLHTCIHGAQWNEVSPVRWLADAAILIEAGIDWVRVEQQGRRLRHLGPIRETVMALDGLGVEMSREIVSHWRAMNLTSIEKLESGYRERLPRQAQRTRELAWVYLRLSRRMGFGEMLGNLPAYMRQIHHFRAYSRRLKFLAYLAYLLWRGEHRRL